MQCCTTRTEWIPLLSDAANMLTYLNCNSFIPHSLSMLYQKGDIINIIYIPPMSIPLSSHPFPSSGVNHCPLISYLYSTLPTFITLHLHYLASVLSFHLYLTIPDLSLIPSFLLWKVCFIYSYLLSLPYTNTLSHHHQCYYIAISLYHPSPPNMYCKSHISSCALFTPLRTRRNVKGYNGTWHKYYHPNDNR